ncbi:TRAP transporter large permease subunit [Pseudogulbenkiania sp. MAI-1]|uniref:TRAP transporter large permease n=1 Tax=Pseudogulbenkiania sp. MAI-1 TaxID=990370 RepID=UPI000A067A1E|nr:TRAP transporter large permease subunit [Pseudogulbenkiania sp. MAI-1]
MHTSFASPSAGRHPEDWMLALVLGMMALLPAAELLLRATFDTGVFGVAAITQHLGLVVGMLGGAVAARQGQLLAASTLLFLLPPRLQAGAHRFAGLVAAAVCTVLAVAGAEFVFAERLAAKTLAYGVPVWVIELAMPAGFAWIGWRLIGAAAPGTGSRVVALACGGLLAVIASFNGVLPRAAFAVTATGIAVAALLGAPLFAVVGGVALLLFWQAGEPLASLAIDHYRTVVNPTLPALPLFTLAGYLLAESRAPERLLTACSACLGGFRYGPALAAITASSLMTCLTGASGVTILALGGLLLPLLLRSGFPERGALGLVTAAGLPGVLFAPSLPVILYAIVAEVDIREMFLGTLLPALLMAALTLVWGARQRSLPAVACEPVPLRAALVGAKWELALPLIAIGPLFSGLATPVEAAAITAVYAFVVEVVIHRDLRLTDLPRVFSECGLLVGGLLLILGVALGLTGYLVDAGIPERLATWIQATVGGPLAFLLALNVVLLVAGCLVDIFSATVVLAPLLVPIGHAFGLDPVHLGVVFLANLEIGYLTPPVGINLFFASSRFGKPLFEVHRSVVSLLPLLLAGLVAITYLPWLSLALPGLLR